MPIATPSYGPRQRYPYPSAFYEPFSYQNRSPYHGGLRPE